MVDVTYLITRTSTQWVVPCVDGYVVLGMSVNPPIPFYEGEEITSNEVLS